MSPSADAESPLPIQPGQIVGGRWRVVRLIGRGGMGAVYEAQNTAIGKRAALKFIDAEFAGQPEIASRFQREAEAASLVESAHIVHVFDSGTSDEGLPFIVMELLRGEDLRTRLRRFGKLPPAEAVHIVAQTLRGLHRAHEAGIMHRDLKPDNIFLVDRDDDPLFAKIVDFGISKITRRSAADISKGTLTRQGVVLGTPFYMSPEQAQALPDLDERTDLWALGAILFECLVGRPPFTGDAYEQIIVAICTADAPDLLSIDPSLPPALAAVVRRALSRDPSKRFQTAKEMLDALQTTGLAPVSLAGATSQPRPADAPSTVDGVPAQGRTKTSWSTGQVSLGAGRKVALGAVALLVGVALVLVLVALRPAPRPRPAALVTNVPSARPSAATTASADVVPSVVAASSAPAASASARPAVTHGSRIKAPSATAAGAASSPTTAATPKTGVAGGLQIKTSYP
jgi:serine/threonine-protein kinase